MGKGSGWASFSGALASDQRRQARFTELTGVTSCLAAGAINRTGWVYPARGLMGRREGLVRGVIGTECEGIAGSRGAGCRAKEGRKDGDGGKMMVVEVDCEVRGGEKGMAAAIRRRRQRRPEAAAAAAAAAAAGRLHANNSWTRLGEAAVSTTGTSAAYGGAAAGTAVACGGATAVAAAEAAVGLLPCSSLSSHLRGRMLLSFFK